MLINFSKYHGTGNDFILIDNRNLNFPVSKALVAFMCHRRFGIGADGLMLVENDKDYHFRMRYFNSDGNEGSMCGNGGRCIVAFAKKLGIINSEARFTACDGAHFAKIDSIDDVELEMQDVSSIEINEDSYFLNTGSPHLVQFIDTHNNFDTYKKGKEIRYSETFKEKGTNVNFVSTDNNNNLFISTYERGVEDETYSCGTGCVASAIAYSINTDSKIKEYNIKTKGGSLKVSFEIKNHIYTNIKLKGPTANPFDGTFDAISI
jgi:diaminopimelate epimerase